MRLLSALGRAALGWLEPLSSPKPERSARDATDPDWGEKKSQRHEETLEARLRKRIRQLESTVAELQSDYERLRRSEKRYRSLVQENISDIVTVIGADGTVLLFESPAIERILGYRPEEQVATDAFSWLYPDDVEQALIMFAEILQTPGLHPPVEFRVPHADGSVRYLEHTVNNQLHDPDIRGIVISSRDITDRKALEEQLKHQALHDSLTNLPNRALFMDRVEHALDRSERRAARVALLFVDLNNFKLVNDSLGHEMGDRLLVAVSERLQTCLPLGATLARIGGDEFTILLEDITNKDDAIHTASQITEEFELPFMLEEREVFTKPSVGIALSTSNGKDRPEDLLRTADVAMYQAKSKGHPYSLAADKKSMPGRALKRLELEGDLRRAIERDELGVYYQPIVLLESGRTVGVEALARWEHPERGLLHPSDFIPAAEEANLIVPLGRWVVEVACRQARVWQAQYPSDLPLLVSVNLSAKQFQQPNLADEMARVLRESGLPPSSLTLEITENAVMENAPTTFNALQELYALGIKLAIDDFGTGYSSMSYLKRFPVDYVKIDRSFVEELDEETDEVVASGIVSLVRALNMKAIAEGVETAEQLARLRQMGCEMAQGYYFSEPLPSEALSVLLAGDRE
jgi:diguanylate cyclase (GGDEF)-like protein/PAS domain S-box-containing protein